MEKSIALPVVLKVKCNNDVYSEAKTRQLLTKAFEHAVKMSQDHIDRHGGSFMTRIDECNLGFNYEITMKTGDTSI